MSLLDRNGLGPSKEGEAQYSVVHCTGYIKAWPPAGRQTPSWYSCVYRHLAQTLAHGRRPLLRVVCVAWPNRKQLQIQRGFDLDTRRKCRFASVNEGVIGRAAVLYLFIYYSDSLCPRSSQGGWVCLGWFPKWCLLSQQADWWNISGELIFPATTHTFLLFSTPGSGISGSGVIQRSMRPLFLVQAISLHADFWHHPVAQNWKPLCFKLLLLWLWFPPRYDLRRGTWLSYPENSDCSPIALPCTRRYPGNESALMLARATEQKTKLILYTV